MCFTQVHTFCPCMYFSVVYSVHFSDCVSSYDVIALLLWRAYFYERV